MGWGFDSKSRKERQVTPVEERGSNVLGTAPIGRLMLKLAVPAVAAQFINMLYNIVDRIYIGHIPEVGDLALTGVGVTFPIITLVSAFAAFAGQGGAPLAAIQLGAGKKDQAERILGNSLALLLMTAAVLTVGFSAFKEPILRAFGASDATIGYASSYIGIYLLGTVFVQLALGLNTFISAQGKAMTAMLSVLIGAVLNIVLDPIFIFVFQWGVRGAALATILSQAVSACWVLAFLCCPHSILRIRRAYVRPDPRVMGKIAGLGVAPFIMQSTESLVTASYVAEGDDLLYGYGAGYFAAIPAGAQVLVIGDGPIGQLAAQLANIAGASRVIMAGSWDEKLAIARECGIHETINYHNEDVIQRARELTEGGPEIVIETSGSNVALNMAVQALKPTGRIVAVSWYNGANVDVAMNTLIVKDAALIGSLASPNSFTPVLRYMVEGKLKVKPLITHIKRLEDFQNVIEMIRAKKEMRIKVLLKP